MPKGKTSRPYNRKEKKASAVKPNARSYTNDSTLRNEKEKSRDRRTGAQLNRNGLTRTSRMQRGLFSTDGKGKRMGRPSKKK